MPNDSAGRFPMKSSEPRNSASGMKSLVKPGSFTLGMCGFSLLVCCIYAWAKFFAGDLNMFPKLLKPFLGPGIIPLYVLGTITNSFIVAYSAFIVGMFVVYAGIGVILDALLRLVRRSA